MGVHIKNIEGEAKKYRGEAKLEATGSGDGVTSVEKFYNFFS